MATNYESILKEMQDKYLELAGISADSASDTGIKMKALAAQVFSLYNKAVWIKNQIFPQTATGEYLDMHAETRGLTRKTAKHSSGVLRFFKESPAAFDITIAAGTLCSDSSTGQRYETTIDATLLAGELSVDVPAVAVESGASSNVGIGAITQLVTPPQGITRVQNPSAFVGGINAESDENLRERLLKSYQNISNSTNSAFYYNHAMSFPEGVSACVIPRARGIGTVDVVIATAEVTPPDDVLAKLQESFDKIREINVDVKVCAPTVVPLDISVAVKPGNMFSFDDAKVNVQSKLAKFFSSFTVSRPMLLAELYSCLLGTEGVYTFTISTPTTDIYLESNEILVPGEITITELLIQ
ncbi:MAG: baseplate J/gp47 family protein [Oscillospiraceae bacterium]|nr:baseplate J/gp47 family protein [Oscillospiraceae bacterium]